MKFYYVFRCGNCGAVLERSEIPSIHLVIGFTRMCQNCGAEVGSNRLSNVDVVRVKRISLSKWYKPWTWRMFREEPLPE